MIKSILVAACLVTTTACASAPSTPRAEPVAQVAPSPLLIVDDDVSRFWVAYDAVRAEANPARQAELFQRLYVDPATPGLRAFMEAKAYAVETYLNAIGLYPAYWDSIRPRTALASRRLARLESHLETLRRLYPELQPAGIYFEVGALRSSGTTLGDKVLIGVEMATADATADISQMPPGLQRFMTGYLASQPLESLDLLITHEVVHTQQRGERRTLLAQALYEGVADFVAEKATGRLPDLDYVTYGPAHDTAVREAFRRDMMGSDFSGWLYNNAENPFGTRDLGYYVGYAIASGYYAAATDKRTAIRELIELDYADQTAIDKVVDASDYFDD